MFGLERYRGLAFIALWQTAPIVVQEDSAGRLQIHFAAGGGQYENVTTNCEGDVLDASARGYAGAGGGAQLWLSDRARANVFANLMSAEDASPEDPWGDVVELSGLSAGGLLALEFRYLGVGMGAASYSRESDLWPLPYARIGPLDGVHLRGDVMSVEGAATMNGLIRLGLGYNQGHLRGTRAFAGIAACHAECEGQAALAFLDLSTPIAPRWDLRAAGLLGPGVENTEMGFTLGVTWHPGLPPAAEPVVLPAPE